MLIRQSRGQAGTMFLPTDRSASKESKKLRGLSPTVRLVKVQRAQGLIHVYAFLAHARHRRAAVRADVPWQLHQLAAVLAFLLQLGMAVWADLPVVLDAP